MNTISNFSNNQQTYNQNVKFNGLNIRQFKKLTPVGKEIEKQIMDHHHNVAFMLGQKPKEIIEMTKGASGRRLHLLEILSEKYNARNFHASDSQKENSQHVNNIYKMITKPNQSHFYIASRVHGSMENMERIFVAAKDNPKRLGFVRKVNESVLTSAAIKPKRPELIAELLESKNSEQYVGDFRKYKSYLILNKDDENAVKNLDKMVESKTFNPKKYDLELNSKRLFDTGSLTETSVLSKKALAENYSPEGQEFLTSFAEHLGASKESLKAGNDKDILHMYQTTTKDNIAVRSSFIEGLRNKKLDYLNSTEKNNEITEMRQLFDTIDKDKHAKGFVEKALDNNAGISSVKEFNTILNAVSPKKLDIFFSNAQRIMKQTSGEERISALQNEIKNPFFETKQTKKIRKEQIKYGYIKKETIFSKAKKYVANKINIARDRMTAEVKPAELPVPGAAERPVKPVVSGNNITDLNIQLLDALANNLKTPEIKQPIIEAANRMRLEHPQSMQISRIPSKAPNAKKLAVINDINSIIEKKLGPKTLSEQKREYAIKATKMRMNMLPEIFASIKETRAAERASGKKLSVSNKDALDLYERINGRNKRLVNYMLKKRNADGSRMFGLKDIITTLDKAEKKVIADKKAAPKTYRAADAKAYYNGLLEANIQQYGKLQRQKKS